jgi:hypothetical protein
MKNDDWYFFFLICSTGFSFLAFSISVINWMMVHSGRKKAKKSYKEVAEWFYKNHPEERGIDEQIKELDKRVDEMLAKRAKR